MSENRPTHHLVLIENATDKTGKAISRFHEVAPLWETKTGHLSGSIPPGMTLTGRILISPAKASSASQDSEAAAIEDSLSET